MSKHNRLRMYKKLLENDKLGRRPGLSQDDGALLKEFGKPAGDPQKKASESSLKKGDK